MHEHELLNLLTIFRLNFSWSVLSSISTVLKMLTLCLTRSRISTWTLLNLAIWASWWRQTYGAFINFNSRDWDRSSSPLDNPSSFKYPAEPPHVPANPLIRQRSVERPKSRSSSRSSPIDWDEYYTGGDDLELFENYMTRTSTTDEECDAYEEFLKQSGQL